MQYTSLYSSISKVLQKSFPGKNMMTLLAKPVVKPPRLRLQVGNTVLIVFVSFFGSRVHRPRFIGGGALLACLASLLMAIPHFLSGPYEYTDRISCETKHEPSKQLASPLIPI